jgi:hypothetical protein
MGRDAVSVMVGQGGFGIRVMAAPSSWAKAGVRKLKVC